jgi:hypothetical protein
MQFVKPDHISIKDHPKLNEGWVQERIAEDPSILGLGDLLLKDKERFQPRAGRLDLLLQDPDLNQRYEVEVQLGQTDESHIIRTIEYWDIERKRYPQYEHTAVIVAEDITSRFLNVVSLFNGFIPLVAVKMNAIRIGEQLSLIFTTVLDEMPLGLVEEDEEVQEVTDRAYWEDRSTRETVQIADQILELIRTFAPDFKLKYNKFYIGLAMGGKPNNFVTLKPRKKYLNAALRLERSDELEERMEDEGLELIDYHKRNRRYRIRFGKGDVEAHADFLTNLLKQSYEYFNS